MIHARLYAVLALAAASLAPGAWAQPLAPLPVPEMPRGPRALLPDLFHGCPGPGVDPEMVAFPQTDRHAHMQIYVPAPVDTAMVFDPGAFASGEAAETRRYLPAPDTVRVPLPDSLWFQRD